MQMRQMLKKLELKKLMWVRRLRSLRRVRSSRRVRRPKGRKFKKKKAAKDPDETPKKKATKDPDGTPLAHVPAKAANKKKDSPRKPAPKR